jgi:hypothetical protein
MTDWELDHREVLAGSIKRSPAKVSVLLNSLDYLLEFVFILETAGAFRLVVKTLGVILTDELYATVEAAQAGFKLKYCGGVETIPLRWSEFLHPEVEWMSRLLFMMNRWRQEH